MLPNYLLLSIKHENVINTAPRHHLLRDWFMVIVHTKKTSLLSQASYNIAYQNEFLLLLQRTQR